MRTVTSMVCAKQWYGLSKWPSSMTLAKTRSRSQSSERVSSMPHATTSLTRISPRRFSGQAAAHLRASTSKLQPAATMSSGRSAGRSSPPLPGTGHVPGASMLPMRFRLMLWANSLLSELSYRPPSACWSTKRTMSLEKMSLWSICSDTSGARMFLLLSSMARICPAVFCSSWRLAMLKRWLCLPSATSPRKLRALTYGDSVSSFSSMPCMVWRASLSCALRLQRYRPTSSTVSVTNPTATRLITSAASGPESDFRTHSDAPGDGEVPSAHLTHICSPPGEAKPGLQGTHWSRQKILPSNGGSWPGLQCISQRTRGPDGSSLQIESERWNSGFWKKLPYTSNPSFSSSSTTCSAMSGMTSSDTLREPRSQNPDAAA
mmetsp:Transcript_23886/g.56907  ORF Transcript_23886/g.56907 Transcript_23886/m.56907 type:complete len:376 (+) Transcript_23886:1181-2308(+)